MKEHENLYKNKKHVERDEGARYTGRAEGIGKN